MESYWRKSLAVGHNDGYRLTKLQFITDTQCGSAMTLKDEMGLFPFARSFSSRLNWRRSTPFRLQLVASLNPSRIQRVSFARKYSSAATSLPQWMLPKAERSPPIFSSQGFSPAAPHQLAVEQ
jgi:hypothetical protein